MALYEEVRSKIVRQELDVVAGQHFSEYSAKVKYTPANIEKEGFFNLCNGIFKKGDEVTLYTSKKAKNSEECFEVYYKFLVVDVDTEAKKVDVLLLKKVDLLNYKTADVKDTDTEIKGIDTETLNIIVEKVLDDKIAELKETFEKYTKDTDDQLEEIEQNIEKLKNSKTKV